MTSSAGNRYEVQTSQGQATIIHGYDDIARNIVSLVSKISYDDIDSGVLSLEYLGYAYNFGNTITFEYLLIWGVDAVYIYQVFR